MVTKVVAISLPKGNSEEFKMYPSSLAYFIRVVGYGANCSEGRGPFRKALFGEIKVWTMLRSL